MWYRLKAGLAPHTDFIVGFSWFYLFIEKQSSEVQHLFGFVQFCLGFFWY
jgi:hypothetical protein